MQRPHWLLTGLAFRGPRSVGLELDRVTLTLSCDHGPMHASRVPTRRHGLEHVRPLYPPARRPTLPGRASGASPPPCWRSRPLSPQSLNPSHIARIPCRSYSPDDDGVMVTDPRPPLDAHSSTTSPITSSGPSLISVHDVVATKRPSPGWGTAHRVVAGRPTAVAAWLAGEGADSPGAQALGTPHASSRPLSHRSRQSTPAQRHRPAA